MSKFQTLRRNRPVLEVKENAREVIFKTISSMCDNVSYFKFKKNSEGDFRLSCTGSTGIPFAYSNFGIDETKDDLEWSADDYDWKDVVSKINSGYQVVESVKSR